MITVEGNSFAYCYEKLLKSTFHQPEYISSPRGQLVKENLNASFVLSNPLSCFYQNEVRSSQKKYIAAELLYNFNASNSAKWISEYAGFWESIQNEDGTVNSAYGHILFTPRKKSGITQWEWAMNSLKSDEYSRQALFKINQSRHQVETKDFPCTVYGIFHIRENRLHLTIHMRSQDAILGCPTDVPLFVSFQVEALNQLRSYYPNLELGTYTHFCNSFHIYEKHFNLVERMLDSSFKEEEIPLSENCLLRNTGSVYEYSLLYLYDKKFNYAGSNKLLQFIQEQLKNE